MIRFQAVELGIATVVATVCVTGCTGETVKRSVPSASPAASVAQPSFAVPSACAGLTGPRMVSGAQGPITTDRLPSIGPIRFGVYPYAPGYPDKTLVYARYDQDETITLTGHLCGGDGRPLRFWYHREGGAPGPVPMTEQHLRTTGDLTASLSPMPKDSAHGGYFMFSTTGVWAVTVEQGNQELGVLLIDVLPCTETSPPQC
jgi:hypothetical protein